MQSLWRTRVQKVYFKQIMKGVRMQRVCEDEYLNQPRDIVKLCNYMLFLHTFPHDYDRGAYLKFLCLLVIFFFYMSFFSICFMASLAFV